jgi:FkbM family methyltransferase
VSETTVARTKWRYRWSHRHPLHLATVRAANRILPALPFGLKYAVTDRVRAERLPYRLLHSLSVAIQVGAPRDTLRAGRSRAMAFARRTRPHGQVLVIEPDSASAEEFRVTAERHGLRHVSVVCAAAWFERTTLTMAFDAKHPATNFTSGCADYSGHELLRFQESTVDAAPIDNLAEEAGLRRVDLVSITTNGAEEAILGGMRGILERDRPHICLARTADSYSALMDRIGYELLGDDDRGFTFRCREG